MMSGEPVSVIVKVDPEELLRNRVRGTSETLEALSRRLQKDKTTEAWVEHVVPRRLNCPIHEELRHGRRV